MHTVFSRINRKRQWWQLPTTTLKVLNLLSQRLDLRDMNLYDTSVKIKTEATEEPPDVPIEDSDDWPEHPMRVRRSVAVPAHGAGNGNGNGHDPNNIAFGNT